MSEDKVLLKFTITRQGGDILPSIHIDSEFKDYLRLNGTVILYAKMMNKIIKKMDREGEDVYEVGQGIIDPAKGGH